MQQSLQQYIDLYGRERQALEEFSPAALNALRPQALQALEKAGGLPTRLSEGFEKTSVADIFAPDMGLNLRRHDLGGADVAAAFRCGVPNLSTLLALVVNDRFAATDTLRRNLPRGVTVCSMAGADGPWLAAHYGAVAPLASTGVALNTLLAQGQGVVVHIGRGMRLDKPLQLVDLLHTAPGLDALMAVRRLLVVADEGAEAAILKCDHTQDAQASFASLEVVEMELGRDARLQWYDIEESTPRTSRYSMLYARQGEGSDLNVCLTTLANGVTRNELHVSLEGPRTRTRLGGMAIGSGKQHIDNYTYVAHRADGGHSDQNFKYALDGEARGAFEGTIEVARGARFVQAYQNNRNVVASAGARMHTRPQLLIYNDDVRCSHGAATGRLDENALFYMQQRGIPLPEARTMLMQAFMVDIIDAIGLETLRDRLRHMVERRFAMGEGAPCAPQACASCANCPQPPEQSPTS